MIVAQWAGIVHKLQFKLHTLNLFSNKNLFIPQLKNMTSYEEILVKGVVTHYTITLFLTQKTCGKNSFHNEN